MLAAASAVFVEAAGVFCLVVALLAWLKLL